MKSLIVFLFCTALFCTLSPAQSLINKDSLFAQSKNENKPVFLLFSGSDWCANCIRFENTILKDSMFQSFLQENLLFLRADFPQRKKQPEIVQQQNELLAEQFNPDGIFPSIVIISSTDKTISVAYHQENAVVFTEHLKRVLSVLK